MMEAVIGLKSSNDWVTAVTTKHPISVRVLDCNAQAEDVMRDLVEISLNRTPLDDVVSTIKEHSCVQNVEVDPIDKDRAMAIVTVKGCMGCILLDKTDCFLVSSYAREGGELEWKLIFSEKKNLQSLIWNLKDGGVDVRLKKITSLNEKEALTERQERIIQQALALGYYDFPKKIGIRELAEKFDVSTATISETLRRGQKKILSDYFEEGRR